MAEREQRRTIILGQSIEQRMAGRLQVLQPFAGHAGADVECQEHVQRNLLEAHEIDRLKHTVVTHFEVAGTESSDNFGAIGDEHVHAYGFALCGEGRLLGRRRHHAAQQQSDTRRHQPCHHRNNLKDAAEYRRATGPRLATVPPRRPTRDRSVRNRWAATRAPEQWPRVPLSCPPLDRRGGSGRITVTAPAVRSPPPVHTTAGPRRHYPPLRTPLPETDSRSTGAAVPRSTVPASAGRSPRHDALASRVPVPAESSPRQAWDSDRGLVCTSALPGATRRPRL